MEIRRRVGDCSYEVELHPGEIHLIHADRLKPFVQGDSVDFFHFETGRSEEEEIGPMDWNFD